MTKPRASLAEYTAQHPTNPSGVPAWLPTLPEWPAILTAWESHTASAAQIRGWLIHECGYPPTLATFARVGGYLSKHHPRRTNGKS